jgi:UDP-GlcNAc:undecaprenyl-phosphate/decaprenyl-phosphate GlcNAc-1-phosphate transferase
MHALPLVLALLTAGALAPALVRMLAAGGHTRANYRDRALPFPFGVLVLAGASLALVPVLLVERLAEVHLLVAPAGAVCVYAFGILALGLTDDLLGAGYEAPPRGWRGHGAALLHGELSTGALKAGGALGLALLAADTRSLGGRVTTHWLLAAAVLVLATNVFNLLDLRPGRATKAFVALGIGLIAGSGEVRALWALGLFAAPALVAGGYDLRERVLLGDTGANLLGALAGLWLVLALSPTGQLVALALLALITVYGEFRSISELVERTPLLRQLDCLGRPT